MKKPEEISPEESLPGTKARETWTSERTFLFAVIGGAVGIGNLWRFPYLAGENGGGTFIFIYILCVIFASIPLKMAEVALGKAGRGSPVLSFQKITKKEGRSPHWSLIGWTMSLSQILVLSFYAVIGGWSLKYAALSITQQLKGIDKDGAETLFNSINEDPFTLGFWHLLFIVLTIAIVSQGIKGGLEKAFKMLVPGLLILLLVLVAWAAATADFGTAVKFLFHVDFSTVSMEMFLVALGQAFFSLGVGSGIFMAYGSYVPPGTSVAKTMFITGAADTGVALIAGLAIFPFVFSYGLSPAAGPGLFFETLPLAFGAMTFGPFVAFLFFSLVSIAALSSSLGMLEVATSRFKELWPGNTAKIAIICGGISWCFGILSVLSFSVWKDIEPLAFIPLFEGKSIFRTFDYAIGNFVLPLNGILLAIFCGWVLSKRTTMEYLDFKNPRYYKIWIFLVRWVIPLPLIYVTVIKLLKG